MPDTNITEDHRYAFEALTSGPVRQFPPLVSPPSEDGGEPEVLIRPLFIWPTAAIRLTDHDGCEA